MRYLAFLLFTFLFSGLIVSGQEIQEKETQPGELSLRIKNINFIKNNEYFNPIAASKFILISSIPGFIDKSQWIEGYTLPGFFFQPELVYSPSGKVTLRGGIHFLRFSGAGKFTRVRPIISTTLNISEKTSLTLGSLSGSDSHRMFDPHFDAERLYTNYAEDGLQLTSKNDHYFTDTWLSWENYINKGDSTREIFTFGESFRYSFSPIADFIHVEIPAQLQFKHFGGQISNYPDHVETFFNFATGLRINFDLAQKRFGQAGIEYLQFINNVLPAKPTASIANGNASWFRFHYTYKSIYVGASYWKAHNFYAPNGNPLYASSIDIHSNYMFSERRLITNSIYLNLFPDSSLELFLGLDTYYNICQKSLDYSTTLHLNFDKLFRLATLKR